MDSLGNGALRKPLPRASQVTVRYRSVARYPGTVLVLTLVAPVFATNCYVVAPAAGGPCFVVDAGAGVAQDVEQTVAEHGLEPVAVLATHGHVDHTWDAAQLCERFDVPFRLHSADAYRIADPFGTLGGGRLVAALEQMGLDLGDYREPERIEVVETQHRGAVRLELASLPVTWLHAPGHTEGASLVSVPRAPSTSSRIPLGEGMGREHPSRTVFSGDVLFAGTIGRTDLPGGDHDEMTASLLEPVGALPHDALVLPGHGPATTMELELRRNPFLRSH